MHIKFKRPLRGDYGRARVGDVKLVEKDIGKSLVERGLAVEVDAPKETDKKPGKGDAKPGADA